MIDINGVTKRFEKAVALDSMELHIGEGTVLGLVGSNGGGKSTLLRLLAGVYRCDGGEVLIDGESVSDNPNAKGKCFYIPDFPFFYSYSTLENTAALYRRLYPNWSDDTYESCCTRFPIDRKQRIMTMSKGMQRQAALIIALSTCPRFLFLDEIFDGLDPVIRLVLKQILMDRVASETMTVVIASHNLRELEDVCDRVCLIHHGKALLDRSLDALRQDYGKVQIGFTEPPADGFLKTLPVVACMRNGNVFNLTLKGSEEEYMPILSALEPAFLSAMPLTLEEVFISEMKAAGYDTNNIR